MANDEGIEPHLGRMRATGGKPYRRYLSDVHAAATAERGGPFVKKSRGLRRGSALYGRGAGYGAVLARRDTHAAARSRRVFVRAHILRLAGKRATGPLAHLRYLQREGVTRQGEPGQLYGSGDEIPDAKAFRDRTKGDRHQFRLIVSPEDGMHYEDLKSLTRRLMMRLEQDFDTRLDWVAADHFNTGHPHTHIIVRGKDDCGRDLIIAPNYLNYGIRERASELVRLDLGPRADGDIERGLRAQMAQERLTTIDRWLLRDSDAERVVTTSAAEPPQQSLRAGRLVKLHHLGLAEPLDAGRWRLAENMEGTLRKMGERGDIWNTMHRQMTACRSDRALADWTIFEPGAAPLQPIVGQVLAHGLSGGISSRQYLIVDALDGRSHYVDIGAGTDAVTIPDGAIVKLHPSDARIRDADRTIVAVALANGGVYTVDAHLRYDPGATQTFAEIHIDRLEAIQRETGGVGRSSNGNWQIASDHLDRVTIYAERIASARPVTIEILSPIPLEKQIELDGATWLDRDMVGSAPEPKRETGFGRAVRAAQATRRQWLIDNELATVDGGRISYRADLIDILQRRELRRVGAQMSKELGYQFVEKSEGQHVAGLLTRKIGLASGQFAFVLKAKEFTLVPWRPVLDRYLGKEVAGIVRENTVSWSSILSRGPSI